MPRTDVKKYPEMEIAIWNGRYVRRGDVITWKPESGSRCWGRVICMIEPLKKIDETDILKMYVCVAKIHDGIVSEFWVDPKEILDVCRPTKLLEWVFSDSFMDTPVDIARDAYNHRAADLMNGTAVAI